jgi:hypothetical protein
MSDLEDLRKLFWVYDCEDHDVIDAILDKISEQERAIEELYFLERGEKFIRSLLPSLYQLR